MTIPTLARVLSLGMIIVLFVPANAEARKHKAPRDVGPSEKLLKEMVALRKELRDTNSRIELLLRGPRLASADPTLPMPRRNPLTVVAPMPIPDASKTLKGYERKIARSAKLKDLTPKLADKVAEILASCPGSRLTSGYRKGARVAGSGRPSLHSRFPSEAVDMAGNYRCIYAHLHHWPGGYSIDPQRVRHVHISLARDRRERGARFAHYRPRHGIKPRSYAAVQ